MKTGLTKFLTLGSMALLALASCKKNDPKVMLNTSGSGTLSASTTTPTLDKTKLSDTSKIITFTTTAPKFGFSSAVTTTLQIDADGDNWQNPSSTTLSTKVYSQGFNTTDFNNLLLKLKLAGGVTSKVNVRMQFSLSAAEATYSNVVSLTVTPFNLTSWIYATGVFSGWANPGALEDSLVSVTGNGVYTGIINFTNAAGNGDNEFLLLPVKGSWAHKYATNDAKGATSSTITYDAPNNFYAPDTTGYYIVTADLNKDKISFQRADFYSLIGNDFTGQNWGTDNFMKFVNDGNNNWVITTPMIAPTGGGFKVRQDSQWSNSWGFLATPDGKTLSDQTGTGGAQNMSISAAGTYTMTFTMAPSAYGTNPYLGAATPTLVPYTLVKQ